MHVKDFKQFINEFTKDPHPVADSERCLISKNGKILFGIVSANDFMRIGDNEDREEKREKGDILHPKKVGIAKIQKDKRNFEVLSRARDIIALDKANLEILLKNKSNVTKEEACSLLKISFDVLNKRIKEGFIHEEEINNLTRIPSKDVIGYALKRHEIYYTLYDTARIMNISYYTLLTLVNIGQIQTVYITAKHKRVSLYSIDDFLSKRNVEATSSEVQTQIQPQKAASTQNLIKFKEACAMLNMGERLLNNKIKSKEITPIYFNRYIMFSLDEIKRFQEAEAAFNQINYDLPTAAALLPFSEFTLRKFIGQGKIKCFKKSKKWLIPKEEVDRILQEGIQTLNPSTLTKMS